MAPRRFRTSAELEWSVPTWKGVAGTVLLAVSALALLVNASEIVSVRSSPEGYPFAAHYATEYGWAYASAWHYELACWIGSGSWTVVAGGVVGWLWSRRWWPLVVAFSLLAASVVIPKVAFA